MGRWLGLVLVTCCATTLTACSSCYVAGIDNCNSNPKIAREWPSPDGKRKAVESHYDCPGWYALKVEIAGAEGTKTVALDDRPADQARPAVWPELKVEWKSDRELWITYPRRQDTTCISSAGGVTIHCLDGTLAGGAKETRAQ